MLAVCVELIADCQHCMGILMGCTTAREDPGVAEAEMTYNACTVQKHMSRPQGTAALH